MTGTVPPILTPAVLIAAIALINGVLLAWWWVTSDQIAAEGGIMENLQVILLGGAVYFFAQVARSADQPVREFATFMCIATFYLLVRELDFRALPGPDWMQWLSSKTPRRVGQVVILLVLFAYALKNVRKLVEAVLSMRPSQRWMYAGIFFLFALAKLTEEISRADKNPIGDFALSHGQFWEELLEFNADLMLFVAAIHVGGVIRKLASKS